MTIGNTRVFDPKALLKFFRELMANSGISKLPSNFGKEWPLASRTGKILVLKVVLLIINLKKIRLKILFLYHKYFLNFYHKLIHNCSFLCFR